MKRVIVSVLTLPVAGIAVVYMIIVDFLINLLYAACQSIRKKVKDNSAEPAQDHSYSKGTGIMSDACSRSQGEGSYTISNYSYIEGRGGSL